MSTREKYRGLWLCEGCTPPLTFTSSPRCWNACERCGRRTFVQNQVVSDADLRLVDARERRRAMDAARATAGRAAE